MARVSRPALRAAPLSGDPVPSVLLRAAYEQVVDRGAGAAPTLFEVTTALEERLVRQYGPGTQGEHTPRWQKLLSRIGLGTTRDVRDMLRALRLTVEGPP